MNITRAQREELNALSKEVFGSSSRWVKMVDKGYVEAVTSEVTEYVPGEKEGDEGTERQVTVPVTTVTGMNLHTVTRHTPESVKEWLLDRKKKLEDLRAMIKQHQEEEKAKKDAEALANQLNEEFSGSAK